MEKYLSTILILMIYFIASAGIAIPTARGIAQGPKEKLTKIHFYSHETVDRNNPRMINNPLTEGPEPDSKIIGRAERIYDSAMLKRFGLLMTLNLVFTQGEYNGSTLSVYGYNPVLHKYPSMSIVGGSGIFRIARGIAATQTVWFNRTGNQDALVEYNVMVFYYA